MGPLERLRRRLFALARPPRREAFGDRARRMLPPESSQAGESRWLHTWLWLLRLGGIAVVGLNMVTGFLFAGLGSLQNPVMALGIFLIFLSQLGILADLWQAGPLRQQVGSMVVLLAGLYVAESARPGMADATGAWWPMLFLISGVIYGVGRFTGVLRVAALAALVAVHASMRLWDWRHAPSPFAHDLMNRYATELGQLLVIAVCVAIGMWVGIRGAITVDLGLERERRRHEEEAEVGRAVFEQREADRFIHDAVLHTLRMVALDRSAVPAATAVAASARLARTLGETTTPDEPTRGGLRLLLDRMAARPGLAGLRVHVTGDDVRLPADVAQSFVRAASEALHNVSRHSGVSEARVLVSRVGPRVVVTISDRGHGFSFAGVRAGRGVSESIVARMADVGGVGWVSSEPDKGTVVRLEWEPQPPGTSRPWLHATYGSAGEVFSALLAMAAPLVVHNFWSAGLHAHHLSWPWAGWVAAAIVGVAYLWGSLHGMRHGLSFAASVAITATAWAAVALNGFTLPPGLVSANLFWMAGGAVPLALLQALFRPLRATLTTSAGLVALTAWVVSDRSAAGMPGIGGVAPGVPGVPGAPGVPGVPGVPGGDDVVSGFEGGGPFGALGYEGVVATLTLMLVPVLGMAACWMARLTLERAANEAMLSHETAIRSFDASLLHDAERRALRERNERRAQTVIDFVTAVGSGELDPADPLVRAEADELERAVRAETAAHGHAVGAPKGEQEGAGGPGAPLRAGGPGAPLRAELDRLRAGGAEVNVRAAGAVPDAVGRWLARLLGPLSPEELNSARATVLPGRREGEWRVATVLRPANEAVLRSAQAVCSSTTSDGEQVHLEHYVDG